LISLHQVSKRYTNGPDAVVGVDLAVARGEFVSLLGPSGCGKSTLLRIAAGLEAPSAGEVRIAGVTPAEACRRGAIGVAFQRPALVASRTALENVRLTLEIVRRPGSFAPEDLLRQFGLEAFRNHYPHQLSGGMQQRVNIACALVHRPEILLLDEPFGALDEITRESLTGWLRGVIAETGQTVVLVTHSVEEAVTLSHRIVLMRPHPGRVQSVADVPAAARCGDWTAPAVVAEVTHLRRQLHAAVPLGAAA
jgi:NitT/TauT family transport system ATP-binding protein